MAGKICVYIRDTIHPADLYDSTYHSFAVSIHEVGSNGPLWWKGIKYDWVPLPFKGEKGKVAGEFEVPAGTYLVKGFAPCSNVVTQVAWVQVGDGETVSVNLVPTTVPFCLYAASIGVTLGTAKVQNEDIPISSIAPKEVKAFREAANALIAKLPKEAGIEMMSVEELKKRLGQRNKE